MNSLPGIKEKEMILSNFKIVIFYNTKVQKKCLPATSLQSRRIQLTLPLVFYKIVTYIHFSNYYLPFLSYLYFSRQEQDFCFVFAFQVLKRKCTYLPPIPDVVCGYDSIWVWFFPCALTPSASRILCQWSPLCHIPILDMAFLTIH